MNRFADLSSRRLVRVRDVQKQQTQSFLGRLKDFPHTFQLIDLNTLPAQKMERVISGLESALRVGYKTELENARGKNLLAYLLHRLGHSEEALRKLEEVLALEGQQSNLVTHANKAVILFQQHRFSEAEKEVRTLAQISKVAECQETQPDQSKSTNTPVDTPTVSGPVSASSTSPQDFQYLVVLARAELAYTYTKFGPDFSPKAVAIFHEVIPAAREPERWLWQFGLALTRRRKLSTLPQTISQVASSDLVNEERSVLQLLLDTARNETCSKNLRAKAYAEIAVLMSMFWKNDSLKNEFTQNADLTPLRACERALQLDGTDKFVLNKCGVIFCQMREPERSVELLSAAVSLRPSSTAYHHLALAYQSLAVNEKIKTSQQVSSLGEETSLAVEAGDFPLSIVEVNNGKRQRLVKSPPTSALTLCREDKYVREALENFEQAIEISKGENVPAVFDLAIMLKSLGEFRKACKTLQRILKREECMNLTDYINVNEQIGLCKKELADTETDEVKRKELLDDANNMLLLALTMASHIFAKTPFIKRIGEVWQSFTSLFEAAEKFESDPPTKLKEEAHLLQLVEKHRESLDVLKRLKKMAPEQAKDPGYLQLLVKGYEGSQNYGEAVAVVEMLRCMPQSPSLLQLFGDEHYAQKLHTHAALRTLGKAGSLPTAKRHFRMAFEDSTTGCVGGELLRPYISREIKRFKSSNSSFEDHTPSGQDQSSSSQPACSSMLHVETAAKSDLPASSEEYGLTNAKSVKSTRGTAHVSNTNRSDESASSVKEDVAEVKQCVPDTKPNRPLEVEENNATATEITTAWSNASDPIINTKKLYGGTETARVCSDPSETAKITPATNKVWDVFVLHEEESLEKAKSLLYYLRNIFGLKVTSRDDAINPGTPELFLEQVIEASRVTIVLVETADHKDEVLSLLIGLAGLSPSTVALLVGEAQVPAILGARKALKCPDLLLQRDPIGTGQREPGQDEDDVTMTLSDDVIGAIAELFAFLCTVEL